MPNGKWRYIMAHGMTSHTHGWQACCHFTIMPTLYTVLCLYVSAWSICLTPRHLPFAICQPFWKWQYLKVQVRAQWKGCSPMHTCYTSPLTLYTPLLTHLHTRTHMVPIHPETQLNHSSSKTVNSLDHHFVMWNTWPLVLFHTYSQSSHLSFILMLALINASSQWVHVQTFKHKSQHNHTAVFVNTEATAHRWSK